MRKEDLNEKTVYAYRGRFQTSVEPVRVTNFHGRKFGETSWMEVDVLKEPRLDSPVKRTESLDTARRFLCTWEEHLDAVREQQVIEAERARVKLLGIEDAERARQELAKLWPPSVPVSDNRLIKEHQWAPNDTGALTVMLDVRTILALVKAARKEALDEFAGSGGRFDRIVDHG